MSEEPGAYFEKLVGRPLGNRQVSLSVNIVIGYFLVQWKGEDWGIPNLLPLSFPQALSLVVLIGITANFYQSHRYLGPTPVTHADYRRLRQALKGYVQVYSFTEKKQVTRRIPPWISLPLACAVIATAVYSVFKTAVAPWVGAAYPPGEISIYQVFLAVLTPAFLFGLGRVLSGAFMEKEAEGEEP